MTKRPRDQGQRVMQQMRMLRNVVMGGTNTLCHPGCQGKTMQDRAAANALCAPHPGAEVSQPFGPEVDVWKVAAKIFAAVSDAGTVVKTDSVETARLVIEMGHATRAPYFHASWVQVPFGTVGKDELAERIATSYALIRASLPKKVQADLG